jgi:hypothetical protein
MNQTNQELNKPLNPRTLTFVKYILTISFVIFYTTPVLGFLDTMEKIKFAFSTLVKIQIILLILAVACMIIYSVLRIVLHKKSTYQYNKNEKLQLIIFFIFCGLILSLSLVYTILELELRNFPIQITFYVIEPIVIILGIVGSMLEQRARINEQITIYNVWYESLEKDEKAKEKDIRQKKSASSSDVKIINNENIVEKEIKNKENPFMDDKEEK